jgi:hypothetical protein
LAKASAIRTRAATWLPGIAASSRSASDSAASIWPAATFVTTAFWISADVVRIRCERTAVVARGRHVVVAEIGLHRRKIRPRKACRASLVRRKQSKSQYGGPRKGGNGFRQTRLPFLEVGRA